MGGVAPQGEDAGEGRSARQHLLHRRVSDPTHVDHGGGCSGTTGCILKKQPKRIFHAAAKARIERWIVSLSSSDSTLSKHTSDDQNYARNEINSELQHFRRCGPRQNYPEFKRKRGDPNVPVS